MNKHSRTSFLPSSAVENNENFAHQNYVWPWHQSGRYLQLQAYTNETSISILERKKPCGNTSRKGN